MLVMIWFVILLFFFFFSFFFFQIKNSSQPHDTVSTSCSSKLFFEGRNYTQIMQQQGLHLCIRWLTVQSVRKTIWSHFICCLSHTFTSVIIWTCLTKQCWGEEASAICSRDWCRSLPLYSEGRGLPGWCCCLPPPSPLAAVGGGGVIQCSIIPGLLPAVESLPEREVYPTETVLILTTDMLDRWGPELCSNYHSLLQIFGEGECVCVCVFVCVFDLHMTLRHKELV